MYNPGSGDGKLKRIEYFPTIPRSFLIERDMKWHQIKYKLKWFIIETNLFKHTFNVEGFVYVDTFRNPVNDVTKRVRWLGTVDVHCRYKDMDKKAIEAFGNMYPQYRGYVWIF